MKNIAFALLATMMLGAACKKEDKPFVISKDTVSGNYKLTAATVGGVNIYDNTDPSMNLIRSCMKDDIHQFKQDLTYVIVDVGETCNPTSADNGTWKFISSTQIEIDGEAAAITSFDGKKLVLTGDAAGIPTVITFTKQ